MGHRSCLSMCCLATTELNSEHKLSGARDMGTLALDTAFDGLEWDVGHAVLLDALDAGGASDGVERCTIETS